MNLILAKNKNLETHSLIVKLIRIFSVPLLNNLPSGLLKKIAKASSRDANKIVKHAGSTHALEVMYTRHHRSLFSRGILQGLADWFWHHCLAQLKAIRNRLKIVEENIEKEILKKISVGQNEIALLTVGGGSARAIIQSISRLQKQHPHVKIKVINIDKDQGAIELGKNTSVQFGLEEVFTWINESAFNIQSLVSDNSIDIVEMVGLLDYFSNEKGVKVMRQINNVLKNDGLFIVANVYPNSEVKFVSKIGWPQMYYRLPQDIESLLRQANFLKELTIILEPLKVHLIALTRK